MYNGITEFRKTKNIIRSKLWNEIMVKRLIL